jgi:hypothetical protein
LISKPAAQARVDFKARVDFSWVAKTPLLARRALEDTLAGALEDTLAGASGFEDASGFGRNPCWRVGL